MGATGDPPGGALPLGATDAGTVASDADVRQLREAQLRGILETASEGIVTVDASQTVVMANRAAAEMFGVPMQELVGSPLSRWVPQRLREQHARHVGGFVAAGGQVRRIGERAPVMARRADGTEFPIEAGVSQAHVDGMLLHTVIISDLSRVRRAESALLDSERMLAAAFGANTVPMAQVDPVTRRFTAVNAAFCRLYGHDEAMLLAMGPDDLNHPEDPLDRARFAALLAGTAPYRVEKRVVRADGSTAWVTIDGSVVRDGQGRALSMLAVVQDVTARRLAEDRLRAREARQTFILQLNDRLRQLGDPAAVVGEAARMLGEFVGASRVGYAEDDGNGETVTLLRHYLNGVPGIEGRHRYADYEPRLLAALREGHTLVRPDIAADPELGAGEKAAHERLQVAATVNVPLLKAGQLAAILFVHSSRPRAWTPEEVKLFEEVAERVRADLERARAEAGLVAARAQLEAANAELQRLVTARDHAQEQERLRIARELHDDLEQNLAAIVIEARAALQAPVGDAPAAQALARIAQTGEQAIASTRRIVMDLRPQALEDLGLPAALEWLARQFTQRTHIDCRLDVAALDASADARLGPLGTSLYRMAQEALNNVGKHARAQSVQIALSGGGNGSLRLSIRDDGRGMAPRAQRAPEAFGLLGMRERVRAAGGTMAIASAPGEGTRIDIEIPLPGAAGGAPAQA